MEEWEKYQPAWKVNQPTEPIIDTKPIPRQYEEDEPSVEFSMVATPFNPHGGVDDD